MAERRMFAKTIIDSDAFMDMPLSAQALYFHLSMRADDDGFVNNAKKIQRMIGASDDDCKLLIMKRFVLTFESGVIVIKHWRINNYIQKDRYKETLYLKEKSTLSLNENNAYTECIQNVSKVYTQDSIGKDSIELVKDSIISKQASNLKKKITNACEVGFKNEDYNELLDEFQVFGEYRNAIFRFIGHLKVNFGLVMMNDRLEDLIIKLDRLYSEDCEKVNAITDAIIKGYKRLECE
jgi:hypothetical protein